MPRARNAPKLWPAMPSNATCIVSSGKPCVPVLARDRAGQHQRRPSGCALRMREREAHRLPRVERRLRAAAISWWSSAPTRPWSCVSPMAARDFGRHRRLVEDRARNRGPSPSSARCPRRMSRRSARPIRSSKRADAELRHDLAHFLGDEEEEVDDVLGLAGEFAAQHRDPASRCRPGTCSGGTCAS